MATGYYYHLRRLRKSILAWRQWGSSGYRGGGHGSAIVSVTGGTVVAINHTGAAIGADAGNNEGSISISGGTIIATGKGIGFDDGESTPTTITGDPIIFATAINGTESYLKTALKAEKTTLSLSHPALQREAGELSH